jgi:hypothetical protein
MVEMRMAAAAQPKVLGASLNQRLGESLPSPPHVTLLCVCGGVMSGGGMGGGWEEAFGWREG